MISTDQESHFYDRRAPDPTDILASVAENLSSSGGVSGGNDLGGGIDGAWTTLETSPQTEIRENAARLARRERMQRRFSRQAGPRRIEREATRQMRTQQIAARLPIVISELRDHVSGIDHDTLARLSAISHAWNLRGHTDGSLAWWDLGCSQADMIRMDALDDTTSTFPGVFENDTKGAIAWYCDKNHLSLAEQMSQAAELALKWVN